jgi:hypothetical protein
MLARITGLIILAALAAGCLLASVWWASFEVAGLTKANIDRYEYLARYWLIAFSILAAAWVVLLVKTVRYRSEQSAEEP